MSIYVNSKKQMNDVEIQWKDDVDSSSLNVNISNIADFLFTISKNQEDSYTINGKINSNIIIDNELSKNIFDAKKYCEDALKNNINKMYFYFKKFV